MGSIPAEEATPEIIFRSKLPDIDIPNHLPLHSYVFENSYDVSDRPCIVSGDDVYTYGEVELLTRDVASGLRRLCGVRRDDVVMLLLPNCPEFAIAFLAASRLGATSTTANPFYTPAEIHRQAAASGAGVVITEPAFAPKVMELLAGDGPVSAVVVVGDAPFPDGCIHFSELTVAGDEDGFDSDDVKIRPDDVVAMPFSSGTTGMPKGVMLTHQNLVTSVAQQVDGENPNLGFRRDDVILCVLPMFHIYSLNSILLCGLRAGAAIVVMRRFDTRRMMELVERHGVTVAPFVPPIVVEIAKSEGSAAVVGGRHDMSSVRMVMSGAAPMGRELEDIVRAKMPNAKLGQGYGMTEAGPVLSMSLLFAREPFVVKSGSCGTVVRNAELKIVDPESGTSLPHNQPGEICIRGAQIMKGYLNDPVATQNTIDKEGWLHTGDIGYVDDDDEIFIIDRLKELIKYKGFQVAPAELEAILITMPDITGAAVVPMKDELAGEVPVAFVVRSTGSQITEEEIKQYISKQVVFYKKIHKVFFVEEIPKAPSGKILRKDLRARLAAAAAQP